VNISVYEIDPTVRELAHRWFGVTDADMRRTIVKDGLVALKEAELRGWTHIKHHNIGSFPLLQVINSMW
jgi:hypothetical protein